MPPGGTYFNFNWANDGMNYLVPAEGQAGGRIFHDDNGFTNDLSGCMGRVEAAERWDFCGRHRMITERGGLLRVDEALGEGKWTRTRELDPKTNLSAYLGLGLVATGPLGGAPFQDAFHRLIHWGKTLSGVRGQLQNDYEGGVRIAPRLRVGGSLDYQARERLFLSAGGELAISRGVGASYGQADLGVSRNWPIGKGHIDVFGRLSLRHLRAEEERLTFKGAYPISQTFLQPSAGFLYQQGAQALGFSLTLNLEGSGSHMGAISFYQKLGG